MEKDDFQERMERFYYLVGYAITHWAYIDRSLFEFCEFALGTTERKTATVFYRTPSINDHLKLTEALMCGAELAPESLKRWNKIARAIDKLLPFRNDLAHNPPVQMGHMIVRVNKDDPSKSVTLEPKQWWEIRTEPKKLLREPKLREVNATAEHVLEHIEKVDRLQDAIYALQWELMGRPKGIGPTIPAPVFPDNLE